MKRIALDTSIAIDLLNGDKKVLHEIRNYEVVCLPITVCGELLFGAKNSGRRKQNEEKFNAFIDTCLILNTNSLIAEEYAEIRKKLKDQGNPIPENDLWIAAICIVNDLPLYTWDRHFSLIQNLKLV